MTASPAMLAESALFEPLDLPDLDLLREAIGVAADPNARFELTMRVRHGRPVPMRLLLLHGLVRYLHDRCEHAGRIEAASGRRHTWDQLFPELPTLPAAVTRGLLDALERERSSPPPPPAPPADRDPGTLVRTGGTA